MTADKANEIERKIAKLLCCLEDYQAIIDAVGPELIGNDLYLDYKKLVAELRIYQLVKGMKRKST